MADADRRKAITEIKHRLTALSERAKDLQASLSPDAFDARPLESSEKQLCRMVLFPDFREMQDRASMFLWLGQLGEWEKVEEEMAEFRQKYAEFF
jgi:hypothetical protein